jgi:cytochrome c oxidase cbb3-type subunit 2
MPPFPWLFEEKTSSDPDDVVVNVRGAHGVIVAKRDALGLFEYLLSLNRTYPVQ